MPNELHLLEVELIDVTATLTRFSDMVLFSPENTLQSKRMQEHIAEVKSKMRKLGVIDFEKYAILSEIEK